MPDEDMTRAALKRVLGQLSYLSRALGLVWTAARGWTAVWAALVIVQGLLPIALVLLIRAVVDALVAAFRGAGEAGDLGAVMPRAAALAAVLLLTEGLASVVTWVRTAQSELVQDHIEGLIHAQAARLDLGFYETPEYYDELHRARIDAISQPVALLENLGRLDVIHVMEDGRVVESGSHTALLERGGRYARSWHEQMGSGESCAIR